MKGHMTTGESLSDPVEEALVQLAGALSGDVVRVAPPEERHFDPISIAVAFGGILLVAFLRGFAEQAEGDAEALGRKTASWLRQRVGDLFRPLPDEQRIRAATDDVREAAERAAMDSPTNPEERARAAETSRAMVEDILASTDWAFPQARAAQLSAEVSKHGQRLIGS
jgi:hypothetical protein